MATNKVSSGVHPSFKSTYLQRRANVHDREKYHQLQPDLIEHI